VNRVYSDNDLLAACHQLHGRVLKACGMAFAYGVAIGCVWVICAAYRAGVL
jgi:hypothetical protein